MKNTHFQQGIRIGIPITLALLPLTAAPIEWDNSDSTSLWNDDNNWSTDIEPTSADDLTFPSSLGGTITLASGELALSLTFEDDYILTGGNLALASGNSIQVGTGFNATIDSTLFITGGLDKTGDGTLVLGANNTNTVGVDIVAGTLRLTSNNALGGTVSLTTINDGTTLELSGGIVQSRNISLMQGGTFTSIGTNSSGGTTTIDAAATSVTFATTGAGDIFTAGTGSNDLSGGSAATVIDVSGPGTVRLGVASNYSGSWSVPEGVLEIGNTTALGNVNTASVTLSGGTLSARLNTAANFATSSPANNLLLTANSTLRSDRTSNGVGATHTLGGLSMGSQTLTVEPGPMVTSGTAGITLGSVPLAGNPVFDVQDNAGGNGKLTTNALLGGGVARTIVKTGAGDFASVGGSTDLPSGSSFTATGGGTTEMLIPALGADPVVTISASQNPFGEASVSVTDGGLNFLANGSGTSAVQTYVLPSVITLGGVVTLDPNRQGGNNTNKTFEIPGLGLAADTVVTMSGDNTHGIRVTGPVALAGDATLQGIDVTSRDGLLTLDGGISGSGSDGLTINGGTSPLNLTVNASGTYGGGTLMTGSNVTLNATNGFGTGPTTLSGGSLTTTVAGALGGTVTITGGTLRANGSDFLSANPVVLNGGVLDIRANTPGTFLTGGLTVSGTSGITIGNNGTGTSLVIDFTAFNVSGDSVLTIDRLNNYVPNFLGITLAGNLNLDINSGDTTRVQSITEDALPRTLLKSGLGTLELQGLNTHSGGTEILQGVLSVQHVDALGSGDLIIGDVSGTATAFAQFDPGLVIATDIVARSGGTGALTLDSPTGNVSWNGNLDLQRTLIIDNGSFNLASSISGLISGTGDLTKTGPGEIILSNPSNTFGSGAADSVLVNDGVLTVALDSTLGNPANGATMDTDGILKIDGTFASARTFTFVGTTSGIAVTAGNELTVNTALEGAGGFVKSDAGTLTLGVGLDSSSRGTASSGVTGGILRLQSVKGLSDGGPFTFNGAGGTLELLIDANTDFVHPITQNNTGAIHVDRAIGGSASNGRHTIGDISSTTGAGTLTITGDHGYGLSFGNYTTNQTKTLINNAPGALQITSINGNPGTITSRLLTLGGSGDILVSGDIVQGAGTGSYGLSKTGTGILRLGTSISGFERVTNVYDGTLDLNGLSYLSKDLNLGGAASVDGAKIVTNGGTLELLTGLTFSSSFSPAGASITGTVDLGSISQTFVVNNSINAAVDLEIDGPIIGTAGSTLTKSSTGTLRLSGAGNTFPGLTTVTGGTLELNKSSGDAIGIAGLTASNATISLLASEQLNAAAPITISSGSDTIIDLNDFTETIGLVTLEQTSQSRYSGIRTGGSGTLILTDDLVLNNNSNASNSHPRSVLITGSGTDATPTTDGTLDLGGVTRTISVNTTTVGVNEPRANATIETQIINGGILKTGARTLYLNHPNNTFSGGVRIAEGTVVPASLASLGAGGFTFVNGPAANAGIDLVGLTGTFSDDFDITGAGSGSTTILYSAYAPNMLTLDGAFNLERDIIFDIEHGTVNGYSAVLDVAGTIDDAAFTSNLIKRGEGILKLAAGNTYSGSTTVEKGTLSIPAESALGDSTTTLTIDGGSLSASGSFTFTRDLDFGSNGGTMHGETGTVVEVPGNVTWSSAPVGFYGDGTTIFSGTSTGTGGDLLVGIPASFAAETYSENGGTSHVLSLRGTTTLPAGNVRLTNGGILELGTGDFTHALGTGPGEVQLNTNRGAGWAAHGADRTVNIGGAGASLGWGQTTPPFLFRVASGSDYGALLLGSTTATHTVDFVNPLDLNISTVSAFRRLVVNDGPAAVDARISGGITHSNLTSTGFLTIEGTGTLDISGDLTGRLDLTHTSTGTTVLSGTNSYTRGLALQGGTVVISGDASFGTPDGLYLHPGTTLDASAMTVPVSVTPGGYMSIDGDLLGSVESVNYTEGNGSVSGDLHLLAAGDFYPRLGGTLTVGGDFTLDAGAFMELYVNGTVPEVDHNRLSVTGTVNLAGDLSVSVSNVVVTDSMVFILNDGTDAIVGTFAGIPEGFALPVGGGLALQFTYLANGDGGPVGNDFGATVITDTFSSDLSLAVSAPLAVDLGADMTITYTIDASGPGNVTDGVLSITLPGNTTLVSSSPAGTVAAGILDIPLPALSALDSTTATLTLTAPVVQDTVFVEATVSSSTLEPDYFNNDNASLSAIFAGGALVLDSFQIDTNAETIHLGINTVDGVQYLLECSTDLIDWSPVDYFIGDGLPYEYDSSIDSATEPKKFYRFCILPYDYFGGGGGGGFES